LSQSRVCAAAVHAAQPLRDDALGTDPAHGFEELPAVADGVIDIDDPLAPRRVEHLPQHLLPPLDRAASQVVAVDVQEVEGVIGQPVGLAPRDRVVEEVEMRDAAIVGHGDFAVDHQLMSGGGERGERCAEGFRPVISVAADQRQAAAGVDDGDQPVAVMLDLVQPAFAIRRRWARLHDLQTHGGGLARRRRAFGQDQGRHVPKDSRRQVGSEVRL